MTHHDQFPGQGDIPASVQPPTQIAQPPHLMLVEAPAPQPEAQRLRLAANILSIGRAVGGAALAYRVGKDEYPSRSWLPAITAGALAVTDCIDGKLARRASGMDGQKSVFGAYTDQLSDKVLVNGLMGATALANAKQGNKVASSLLGLATAVTVARDVWVTAKRVQAERSAMPVNTAAQKSGKVKAVVQFAGLAASVAPPMKNKYVNKAVQGVVMASTYMAVKSGVDYHRAYSRAMKNQPSSVLGAAPTVS